MFNPKITEGEWIIKDGIIKSSDDEVIVDANQTHIHNAKAIAAVPELLEVYRAAKENIKDIVTDQMLSKGLEATIRFTRKEKTLNDAIKKLEERHCN